MSSRKPIEQTRAEILDVAWDMIRQRGAEVSLAEIGRTAGISRQSVYDHFGSRGGMIMALLKRADERYEIQQRLFAAFADDEPRRRLERTVDVWFDFVEQIYPVATDLIRLRTKDADASAAWEDRMGELRSWLLVLTTQLETDGILRGIWTPKAASEFLWTTISVQTWGLLTDDCGWSGARSRDTLRWVICQTLLGTQDGDAEQ